MLREKQARGAGQIGREISRVFQAFARTARARRIYQANNAVYLRMSNDLATSLTQLLGELEEISLKVRPDSMIYEEERVLEEPNPDESIPFLFYRDGIRRLELTQGLDAREIEVLINATVEGFKASGLGDDIVSFLWRHDLEHVRYVVVDTTIVDAVATPASSGDPNAKSEVPDLDSQIGGLLLSIYGDSVTDVGIHVAHVDAVDLPAKAIAETLDRIEDLAPAFHPARAFIDAPAYAEEVLAELAQEDELRVNFRAILAALNGLSRAEVDASAREVIADRLLQIYDGALVSGSFRIAHRILLGMRSIETAGAPIAEIAERWIAQGASETRLRQVAASLGKIGGPEAAAINDLFRACGQLAVPTLLSLIPNVEDGQQRRMLADLSIELGIDSLQPVLQLLGDEQAFVAREAIYMLAKLPASEATQAALLSAENHPHAPVRQALLLAAPRLPREAAIELARKLLDDPDQDVVITAAKVLAASKEHKAGALLHVRVQRPEFAAVPTTIKQAICAAYIQLVPLKAAPVLAAMLRKGDGLLATKESEDLAVAAAYALGFLHSQGTIGVLEKSSHCLNKRVREAVREALLRAKGGAK